MGKLYVPTAVMGENGRPLTETLVIDESELASLPEGVAVFRSRYQVRRWQRRSITEPPPWTYGERDDD